jgi:protein-arginine kinase activator protein McsA
MGETKLDSSGKRKIYACAMCPKDVFFGDKKYTVTVIGPGSEEDTYRVCEDCKKRVKTIIDEEDSTEPLYYLIKIVDHQKSRSRIYRVSEKTLEKFYIIIIRREEN